MSRENKETSSFLAKFKKQIEEPQKTFTNALSTLEPPNAFRSVFAFQELDQAESQELRLLLESTASQNEDHHSIQRDFDLLKNITAEIKSIQKQSVLLLGERIKRAREILKKYGDGSTTFTKWLDATFSSRRTAYNCLAYFEFHEALPNDRLRDCLKLMSHKAVYMLASRQGPIAQKFKIVEDFHSLKQNEIIPIIQEYFPLVENEKKSALGIEMDLDDFERLLERLIKRKSLFQHSHRQRLKEFKTLFSDLVE
jgi:hypothetical protein